MLYTEYGIWEGGIMLQKFVLRDSTEIKQKKMYKGRNESTLVYQHFLQLMFIIGWFFYSNHFWPLTYVNHHELFLYRFVFWSIKECRVGRALLFYHFLFCLTKEITSRISTPFSALQWMSFPPPFTSMQLK